VPVTLPGSIYRFENFQLDCSRFELRQNDKFLRVERKPMELLILLASREGRLVTREEITQRLWSSEVFVDTEHGINTAIRKLRYLLRDDSENPRFIQTVTGLGYRFIAPVTTVEDPAAVVAPAQMMPTVPDAANVTVGQKRRGVGVYVTAGLCLAVALGGLVFYRLRHRALQVTYAPLTDFTDSAVAPALSPDGHMVAFIRGGEGFLSSDQIYVKMLPSGEAKRVTDDSRPKYGLAFSPDGSEIAYTVLEDSGFSTYEVSALGGEPHLLLNNAAGLVWLDAQRLLFSEIKTGIHLGVVSATTTRTNLREIYFPAHERGMAHYAFPSPDRQWALVVEMNGNGDWAPCRLIALEGQSPAKEVGPAGGCTSAGWSPDGTWMYFTARVEGRSHIWRQRFEGGQAEQLTFGPTEEDGVAVEPQGSSLITSVGVHDSAIWIHDGNGERQLSSEGEVVAWPPPVFSRDGAMLFYLLRRGDGSGTELWRTAIDTGKSEAVFPGVSMTAFDISPDGKQVVYTTSFSDGTTQLWLAPVDRSSPATKLSVSGARLPHFGPGGHILFQRAEGNTNYLEQIEPGGSHSSKFLPYPIADLLSISPSQQWVATSVPKANDNGLPAVLAIPLDGGTPRHVCQGYCFPIRWSTDGKYMFVGVEESTRSGPGRSLAIQLGPGETLPDLPSGGIAQGAESSVARGAVSVPRADLVPGKDPEHYAWVNTSVHRNLYRISLR